MTTKRIISFLKSITVTLLLFLQAITSFSQQRPSFSNRVVEKDGWSFLPYTQGEVIRAIDGLHKQKLDKICTIISDWDIIHPPQGFKVIFSGDETYLDVRFAAYVLDDGLRTTQSGAMLLINLNDPVKMFGFPVVSDIFLLPQKVADFYGFPVYQNDWHEVTVISKKNIPLFIPVTRKEYLKELILKEDQKRINEVANGLQPASDDDVLREMGKTYQELLKMDKATAVEFKKQMDEHRENLTKSKKENKGSDILTSYKSELSNLSAEELTLPAYYSISAIGTNNYVSGLISSENKENAEALVRVNPALIDPSHPNEIQLLVIRWLLGDNSENSDKPRLYNEGNEGFQLSDGAMAELFKQQLVWDKVFDLVVKE